MQWLEWGYPIILWMQDRGEWLLPPMQVFTFLGNELFFMFVMPILVWCYDVYLGIELGVLLLFSSGINSVLKMAFALPRPYWVNPAIRAFEGRPGFGFPSGHAQNALVMWGQTAIRLRRRMISLTCVVLIFFISISRWYLGIHFPADTLGGWIVGIALLFGFNRLRTPFLRTFFNRSLFTQVTLCFLVSALLLAAGGIVVALSEPPSDLALWGQRARQALPESEPLKPLDIDAVVASAGAWFGLALGGILLHNWGGFKMKASTWQQLLRIIVGLSGVLILYLGLKLLFPSGTSPLPIFLRYFRYSLLGFWVSYLAPRTFMQLNFYQPVSFVNSGSD